MASRNLWRMRAFYLAWTGDVQKLPQPAVEMTGKNLPQVAAGIPWFHHVILLEKVKQPAERLWYIQQTIENGWSRALLARQIETKLYRRQALAKKITNFAATLPPAQSDLARQTLKAPYILDFPSLSHEAQERDLERALLTRYDRLNLLAQLASDAGRTNGIHGLWVLVPANDQSPLPLLNNKPIPTTNAAQHARLTEAWLSNRHCAGEPPMLDTDIPDVN